MTTREGAVLTAYTEILLIPEFSEFHKYAEEILCRPVMTHQFANEDIWKELKEKSNDEFLRIIQNQGKAETASLRKELEEVKAQNTKLVNSLRGAKDYILYLEDEFKLSDSEQTLSDINERLAEYEGKGGGNG